MTEFLSLLIHIPQQEFVSLVLCPHSPVFILLHTTLCESLVFHHRIVYVIENYMCSTDINAHKPTKHCVTVPSIHCVQHTTKNYPPAVCRKTKEKKTTKQPSKKDVYVWQHNVIECDLKSSFDS